MEQPCTDFLKNLVFNYAETAEGSWLKTFDWASTPFDWSPKCNVDNGIMGMYSFGHIYLMDLHLVPDQIFPTLIHELYHRWQWVKHPVYYLIGKLIRPLIEKPAEHQTELAEERLNKLPREQREYK